MEPKRIESSPYLKQYPKSSKLVHKLLDEEQNQYTSPSIRVNNSKILDDSSRCDPTTRKHMCYTRYRKSNRDNYLKHLQVVEFKNSLVMKKSSKRGGRLSSDSECSKEYKNESNRKKPNSNTKYHRSLDHFYNCQVFSIADSGTNEKEENSFFAEDAKSDDGSEEESEEVVDDNSRKKSKFQRFDIISRVRALQMTNDPVQEGDHSSRSTAQLLKPIDLLHSVDKWSPLQSLFAGIEFPDGDTYAKCFKVDWLYSDIPSTVKDSVELKRLYSHLEYYYPLVISIFNYFAALDAANSSCPFIITSKDRLFDSFKIVDDEQTLGLSTEPIKRYDMIRILIVIAKTNYLREEMPLLPRAVMEGGLEISESILCLLQDMILPFSSTFRNVTDFRNFFLVHEDVEKIFKQHEASLRELYQSYAACNTKQNSRKEKKPERQELALESYIKLLRAKQQIDKYFDLPQAYYAFVCSASLVPDQLSATWHRFLTFAQFLEAIGRMAFRKRENLIQDASHHELDGYSQDSKFPYIRYDKNIRRDDGIVQCPRSRVHFKQSLEETIASLLGIE